MTGRVHLREQGILTWLEALKYQRRTGGVRLTELLHLRENVTLSPEDLRSVMTRLPSNSERLLVSVISLFQFYADTQNQGNMRESAGRLAGYGVTPGPWWAIHAGAEESVGLLHLFRVRYQSTLTVERTCPKPSQCQ